MGRGRRAKKAWDIFLDRNVSWYKNAKVRIGTHKEDGKKVGVGKIDGDFEQNRKTIDGDSLIKFNVIFRIFLRIV